jgi:outer membrane protein assembly factor BamE (lipoprotein component of BamABCDE complex)
MKRVVCLVLLVGVLVVGLPGCGGMFETRRRNQFESRIRLGMTKMEVEDVLGEPDNGPAAQTWKYIDRKRSYVAVVKFDKDNRVFEKEWKDLRESTDPEPATE